MPVSGSPFSHSTKAGFFDHLAAFFSPTVAIDSEGNKVAASGFFDSGDGNRLIDNQSFYDSLSIPFSASYDPSSSDSLADDYYDEEFIMDKILDTTEQQNTAAQSSADRAMEFNSEQARLNRAWQEEQNQKAMDFSERMSSTAIQRQMADLKAAGLNPKLAGSLGGASAPSGVTSSGSAASGSGASMAAANIAPLTSLLSTYVTGADALDRQNNQFVQNVVITLLGAMVK